MNIKSIINFYRNYKNFKKTLELSSKLFYKKKIALIGSSNNILGKNYGDLINSFDFVIRFNTAPTKSFEKDVGTKTDLRVISESVMRDDVIYFSYENNYSSNLLNQKILLISESHKSEILRQINNFFHMSSEVWIFENFQSPYVRFKLSSDYNLLTKIKFYKCPPFSVGTTTLMLASLVDCNISLFGFDFNKNLKSYKHYFYDPAFFKRNSQKEIITNHNFELENYFIKTVVKKKNMKIF